MELRKTIYFLLLVVIIIIFLLSIDLNVSYSDNGNYNINNQNNQNNQNKQYIESEQKMTDPLYVNNIDNVNRSNTVFAKIVGRPDISVHKQLLSAENKFYSNRCN